MKKSKVVEVMPLVTGDGFMRQDFSFVLFPKRNVDQYDTVVISRVYQDKNRCTVIFRTGEMQFSTSYVSYNYDKKMFLTFASEIHDIIKKFCYENLQDLMEYDDIACMNASQFSFVGMNNPKLVEKLKKFRRNIVTMFSIRLDCDFGMEVLKTRAEKDMENDYKYMSIISM